jgi:hypothetical protein
MVAVSVTLCELLIFINFLVQTNFSLELLNKKGIKYIRKRL